MVNKQLQIAIDSGDIKSIQLIAVAQEEVISKLEEQLKPANIQQFLTFAAIEGMSTKQINEVFTDLHESNLSSMRKLSLITQAITDNDSEFDSKTIEKIKAVLNGNS